MSLSNNTLNTSEPSFVSESLGEDSTFNKLDLSRKLTEECLIQNTSKLKPSSLELSITLDQEEKEHLLRNRRNGQSSPILNITDKTNNSIENTSNTIKESSGCNIFADISAENEEESVIPVEDDDITEVSTLESTDLETPQKDMFSHLQPTTNNNGILEMDVIDGKENSVNYNGISEMDVIDGKENSVLAEAECIDFQIDESKLFQYSFIEVGRRLWSSTAEKQLYTKGCLWSPDGTCLLVPVNLDGMHIVELPTDLYAAQDIPDRNLSSLPSAVHVKEGGTVYDYCWYPYMNSSDPATCLWLATRQHEPIHMWDAFSGELRCSYRGYDDVDEVESAISVVFSNDAQKVIGGYKKTIKIFDTNIPGRNYVGIPIKKAVSCFALTSENDNCVTAGTWAGYINHYDLRAPKLGPLFTLGGHSGGITWLKYSPTTDQNWYLFSGARKDNKILQWDMRNYTEPVRVFERTVQTNQRIYYDLTPLNMWLATGNTEGLLKIWNLYDKDLQFELHLHQDCCNGVSFHPLLPIIATASGQYHFVDVTTENDDKSTEKFINYENSLLMLWYGPSKENVN